MSFGVLVKADVSGVSSSVGELDGSEPIGSRVVDSDDVEALECSCVYGDAVSRRDIAKSSLRSGLSGRGIRGFKLDRSYVLLDRCLAGCHLAHILARFGR